MNSGPERYYRDMLKRIEKSLPMLYSLAAFAIKKRGLAPNCKRAKTVPHCRQY
jgi:hypothetical protein